MNSKDSTAKEFKPLVWMDASAYASGDADGRQDVGGHLFAATVKKVAAQDACAYDRGVIAGLRQADAICSDREDMTADKIKAEIEACIAASYVPVQHKEQP